MCPTPHETNGGVNGSNATAIDVSSVTNGNGHSNGHANGNAQSNGNGHANPASGRRSNPYAPVGDFLSNVSRFKIIESTLREVCVFHSAEK